MFIFLSAAERISIFTHLTHTLCPVLELERRKVELYPDHWTVCKDAFTDALNDSCGSNQNRNQVCRVCFTVYLL